MAQQMGGQPPWLGSKISGVSALCCKHNHEQPPSVLGQGGHHGNLKTQFVWLRDRVDLWFRRPAVQWYTSLLSGFCIPLRICKAYKGIWVLV